jgi:heme A synthase
LTKALQILFTLTLGLILVFWLGDLFLGTPADVSDRAVTEDWANDGKRYAAEKMKSRLWTLVYAIPTLILLNATVKSIRQKNELLFYRTFLIGLTIFQIIPVAGLIKDKSNDSPFIFPIILTFFVIFTSGQIFSVLKIVKLTKTRQLI